MGDGNRVSISVPNRFPIHRAVRAVSTNEGRTSRKTRTMKNNSTALLAQNKVNMSKEAPRPTYRRVTTIGTRKTTPWRTYLNNSS